MSILRCYYLFRPQYAFNSSEAEYESKRYRTNLQTKIKNILGSLSNLIRFVDFEELLPLITGSGENQCLDLIIVEDEEKSIADLFKQAGLNEELKRVLIIDHPLSMYALLKQKDIAAPKLITLDFQLTEDSKEDYTDASQIYDKIKEKWQETCIIGLTNTESSQPARALENKIRNTGENVLLKDKFIQNLSHFFRDRLQMVKLRKKNRDLEAENTSLKTENAELRANQKPLPNDSGRHSDDIKGGKSPLMGRLFLQLDRIQNSPTTRNIVIQGPSGVGKNVFATAIIKDWQKREKLPKHLNTTIFCADTEGVRQALTSTNATHGATIKIFEDLEFLPIPTQSLFIQYWAENPAALCIFISSIPIEKLYTDGSLSPQFYNRISHTVMNIPELQKCKEDIDTFISFFEMDNEWISKEFGEKLPFIFSQDAKNYLSYYTYERGNLTELRRKMQEAMREAYDLQADKSSKIITVSQHHVQNIFGDDLKIEENDRKKVETFLNDIDEAAKKALAEKGASSKKLTLEDLEKVTNKDNYRQNAIYTILNNHKPLIRILLLEQPNKWSALRQLLTFKKILNTSNKK